MSLTAPGFSRISGCPRAILPGCPRPLASRRPLTSYDCGEPCRPSHPDGLSPLPADHALTSPAQDAPRGLGVLRRAASPCTQALGGAATRPSPSQTLVSPATRERTGGQPLNRQLWGHGGGPSLQVLTFTLVTRDPSAFLIQAIRSSVSFSDRRSPATGSRREGALSCYGQPHPLRWSQVLKHFCPTAGCRKAPSSPCWPPAQGQKLPKQLFI